ncbi:aldehyde dehydrogenase family protein [Halobacillus naozhouensis]|uniref:Aldehyde dehydrogenase family protein n=1 Tax=Halobacillus naozhouensis TaxID=554880 RepID=A0ABY8J1W7_9BACI|nr:aldehyde dehydrogenase family protein [Halobacillus naozhouensis]WFT75567.1 aldehyde dehydrogenase family protein [Halobacillus naozhouensis]
MLKDSKTKLYVNGKWQEGNSYYDLKSPYSGEIIARVPLATPEEVEEALASADRGKEVIKKMTSLERAKILEKASHIFEQRLEECAEILTQENAKPIKAAKGEILRTIETYRFAAEEAKRIHGETIPMDAAVSGRGWFAYTRREPLGVIAAITPFNFPFNLVAHKLGPAIAAGNSVVLKPANQTPLSALLTAEIFEEAGLPPGVLNVVTGRGSVIGDVLVRDTRVKMVTFTGSLEVGLSINAKAGLKKVTLELGSNSGLIVDSTYDLDSVVSRCIEGSFAYAGQVCISIQRIYVQQDLYEEFVSKFVERTKKLVMGDPREENTDVSAMIHMDEATRIEKWVEEAMNSNAEILSGGKREGALFEPTIITKGSSELSVNSKEAFAPIVTINPYNEWDEAIEMVNDSSYGLQAGVFTNSMDKAFDATDRIEVGGVMVNDIPSFRVDQMPYGGVKNSGMGKEGIKYSVEEMTNLKMVGFKVNQ